MIERKKVKRGKGKHGKEDDDDDDEKEGRKISVRGRKRVEKKE